MTRESGFFLLLITVLITIGCSSDSAIQIRFNAEKLYHRADKLFEKASIKPDLQDEQTWSEVKRAYLEVADYCRMYIDSISIEKNLAQKKELETIAYLASVRLGGIYFNEEKLDSTVLILSQLLNMTNLEGGQLLSARLQLAKAKHWQGRRDEALNIYHEIIDAFYPPVDNTNKILTDVLNLPMEIINIHRILEDGLSMAQETRSAENYYLRIINDWPNTALETAARGNLARVYTDDGQHEKAIDQLYMIKDSTGQVPLEAKILAANITASGLRKYETAANMFDELIGTTTDTLILPNLYVRKAAALYESRQYQKCLDIMNFVRKQYEFFYRINPAPQKYIALANNRLGDWPRAEMAFMQLADNYPTTEDAFNAYLFVAEHYGETNNKNLAEVWYNRADEFYDKMARGYPGTTIEASAMSFKAEIARRRQNWEQAVDILVKLYDKFPNTEVGYKALLNAAAVYRHRLNNEQKAEELIDILRNRLVPAKDNKNIGLNTDVNK
jgi:tetratricopeptide (TPR) repeat protein